MNLESALTTQNRVRSAMAQAIRKKRVPHLKRAVMQRGDRLHAPGEDRLLGAQSRCLP